MTYAIVSDVHGNLESLGRAFERVREGDEVLCLGDCVGYGPNPNECVTLLRQRVRHGVIGNHDLAALNSYGTEYFNEAARAAIEWTQTVLTPESRSWLDAVHPR
jgi:predicted phosphodiesterase